MEQHNLAAQSPISEPEGYENPSYSDQIWILCRVALLSLVAPINTTRVFRCSLGCQSSKNSGSFLGCLPNGAAEGSISASRLRHQTVLCSSNYKSPPESMGLRAVLIAQRLIRLRYACNTSLQLLPPPISRITATGVTMHPEDFLTKFPWLARVSLFEIKRVCVNPGIRTRDLPIRRRRLYRCATLSWSKKSLID